MTRKCLDCNEMLAMRPGKGKQVLRCAGCRRAAYKATSRKCSRCLVRPAMPRFSRCEVCPAQSPGLVYSRICRCGVTFEAKNPLKKHCTRSCSPHCNGSQKRKTSARGYGAAHQKRRAELLPLAIGTDCELCGERMWAFDKLDADHVIPVSQGGADGPLRIVHASCNRSRQAAMA